MDPIKANMSLLGQIVKFIPVRIIFSLAKKYGYSLELVGKLARNTSEPVVYQTAIRHNRSLRSLLFRLPFDTART